MNTASSLKVTVNGRKFLITGIRKSTSCKDLLCAIAKATKNSQTLKEERCEEKSLKSLYSVRNKEINCEENLLEHLKGDRKVAGDFESLRIFNNLGKNAKIIAKDIGSVEKSSLHRETVGVDELSPFYKKRKKKRKKNKEVKIKEEKGNNNTKHKTNNSTGATESRKDRVKHRVKHRSVDDSDIDKNDTLTRIRKRRGRVYDDSDIDVYQSLYHMVIDQNKQLHKLQNQSKEVRKTEWIKELRKTSQIYYIDDDQTKQNESKEQNMGTRSDEKDDGNDSGLPSPEYDSSESHENQPIVIQDMKSRDTLKKESEQTTAQDIDSVLKENPENGKQDQLSNQNMKIVFENNCAILPNNISDQCDNKQNKKDLHKNFIVNHKSDEIRKEHDNIRGLNKTERSLNDQSGSLMSPDLLRSSQSLAEDIFVGCVNGIEVVLDGNRNIIGTTTCEEGINKMVAFDAALLQQKTSIKRNDKKKLKKSDISDPVLLSPSTFKKHKSLKKIESVLGIQASDVFQNHLDKTENEKEKKESKFNLKLKEIRRSKKIKSGKSEPEYFPKSSFLENHGEEELKEILEFNVFEKKDKNFQNKNKNKKVVSKTSENKTSDENYNRINVHDYKNLDSVSKVRDEKEIVSPSKTQQSGIEKIDIEARTYNEKVENICENNSAYSEVKNKENSSNSEKNKYESINEQTSICEENQKKTFEENPSHMSNSEGKTPGSIATLNVEIANGLSPERTQNNIPILDSNTPSITRGGTVTIPRKGDVNISGEESDRTVLLQMFKDDRQSLIELIEKVLDYNLLISELSEELEILSNEENNYTTLEDLEEEEGEIYNELQSVKSLLRSVVDLTSYQRKEMSQNLASLDQLDLEVRTKKADYDNLRSGVWKTNSKLAPRSLIKHSKEKRKATQQSNVTTQKSLV